MLRRYSSKDLDSLALGSHKVIGSNSNCDIIIQAEGVSPTHAIIEFHSLTNSFWIKDLSLISDTKVNGVAVLGQVQLATGDLLQFGMSQPLIFENSQIFSKNVYPRFNQPADQSIILPVVGKQIIPQQSSARILESRPRARPPSKRFQGVRDGTSSRGSFDNFSNLHSPPNENGSIEIVSTRNVSVGNNLLQRVVRLQAEIARKDEEIHLLSKRLHDDDNLYVNGDLSLTKEELPKIINNNRTDESRSFELDMYRSFISILASKLHILNNLTLSQQMKDYGDVFCNIFQALDKNFATQMMEIAAECDGNMEKLGYDALQRSRMKNLMEDHKKESISALASELEVILPVIKDCSSITKDCIRACSVFADWSRDQGDLILNSQRIESSLLRSSIKELRDVFVNAQLGRHWIIPSLIPFLQLVALDLEKREKGIDRSVQTEIEVEVFSPTPARSEAEDFEEEKTSDMDFLLNSAENLIKNLTRIINNGVITKKENVDERIENLINLLKKCLKKITSEDILEGYRQIQRDEVFPNFTSGDEDDEDDDDDEMNDADSEFEEEEFILTDPSFFPFKERVSTIYEENSDEMEHEQSKSEDANHLLSRTFLPTQSIDALDMGVLPESPPALPPPSYDEIADKDLSAPPPLASETDSDEAENIFEEQNTKVDRVKRTTSADDMPSKSGVSKTKNILKDPSARPKTTSSRTVRIKSITDDESQTTENEQKMAKFRLNRPQSATVEKHRYRLEKQQRGMSFVNPSEVNLETMNEELLDLDFLKSHGFQLTDDLVGKLKTYLKTEHAQQCLIKSPNHSECILNFARKIEKDKLNEKLMEARKEATQSLTNWFEHSDKPQSICEISHSAHIQSHINTSTVQPIVVQAIPIRSYVFTSPPKLRKKQKSMPTLVQPRMQF